MSSSTPWQEAVRSARRIRDESIAKVQPPLAALPDDLPLDVTGLPKQILSEEEYHITNLTAEDLYHCVVEENKYTSVQVINAFLRRAALAQKLVNCITELLPEQALQRAEYLDSYLKEHGMPLGPLHGIPISVKEQVGMKGHHLNAGYCSMQDNIAEDDADILKILFNAGCVFYARTTEPQLLMHLETSSNLYGVTVNPYNRKLTAGGSSGGEGALLGLRGSCLGLGTDVGGSIRSPAVNNGVYGLRPTTLRLPMQGIALETDGQEQILGTVGPMSTSLEGLRMIMKVVIDAKPWLNEPSLVPLQWKQSSVLARSKIKIGVLRDDSVVEPHPPITRALTEVAEALKMDDRIEIIEWKPYRHDDAWKIIAGLYFPDGGQQVIDAIEASGEPWRPLSEWILKDNPHVKKLDIAQVWELTKRRDDYRNDYSKLWNDTMSLGGRNSDPRMMDAIICPAGPGAAPPLDCARYWPYTSEYNLLDYPAVVFPIGPFERFLGESWNKRTFRNADDRYNAELYHPSTYSHAPIGLQLAARRFEDEKLLDILEVISDITKECLKQDVEHEARG